MTFHCTVFSVQLKQKRSTILITYLSFFNFFIQTNNSGSESRKKFRIHNTAFLDCLQRRYLDVDKIGEIFITQIRKCASDPDETNTGPEEKKECGFNWCTNQWQLLPCSRCLSPDRSRTRWDRCSGNQAQDRISYLHR